jgi:hypothetical protein
LVIDARRQGRRRRPRATAWPIGAVAADWVAADATEAAAWDAAWVATEEAQRRKFLELVGGFNDA